MKVFVTGVGGQLGYDVINELNKRGYEALGSDILNETAAECEYIKLDITDADAVEKIISEVQPDVVIHCAAWTAVDAAEDEDNRPKVKAINVDGTQNIANVCKKLDCKMIYISTDYVFDGQGTEPAKRSHNGKYVIKSLGLQSASQRVDFCGIIKDVTVLGAKSKPKWERLSDGVYAGA